MNSNLALLYNGCAGDKCDCSRKALSERDPLGETYKTLLLVTKRLNDIIPQIETIHNEQNFLSIQLKLKEEYNVSLVKWPDTPVYIRRIPGLCRKTREKLLRAFQKVHENHPKLLQKVTFGDWPHDDE